MSDVTIRFQNKKAADHFRSWLDGQGEQDYWLWMEAREQEEAGDITALSFDYRKGGLIVAKCGRLGEK